MSDFLKSIIKETGNEFATLAKDGVAGGDVDTFIDTGSYSFNALLSGSIFGGLPAIVLQQLLVKLRQVKLSLH